MNSVVYSNTIIIIIIIVIIIIMKKALFTSEGVEYSTVYHAYRSNPLSKERTSASAALYFFNLEEYQSAKWVLLEKDLWNLKPFLCCLNV